MDSPSSSTTQFGQQPQSIAKEERRSLNDVGHGDDDLLNSEADQSLSWSPMVHLGDVDRFSNKKQCLANQIEPQSQSTINTDYESSVADDFETYTSTKYANAEYALLSYSRTNKWEKLQALLGAKLREEIELDLNYKGQQKQNFSWSALHLACYFGHIKVVELILSTKQLCNEIDINIQNNSGDTPLHKATLTNRQHIVHILLSNGANVFIRNSDGLLARQLTRNRDILGMLEAAEQVDKNRIMQAMFKAVDNANLEKLQEYFITYGSYIEAVQNDDAIGENASTTHAQLNSNRIGNLSPSEFISRLTDERGNTLLHLASMRGFKAICVYLLEQGFDPYRKNNLGQTALDLSSYQLRQLFMDVKPANSQLKRLSSQRVTRFEGPLMKKVRILGWRRIYVVLENGVILLFNNRKDSMNRSRRGYKYLESAICEPEPNDIGMFSVCFSDKSKVTFLVTPEQLNNYTSFKPPASGLEQDITSNQIELIRQKWIDSVRDHILYSTEFIKNGLKLHDNDENENGVYNNDGDLATLNHLLPMDTIKSFIQEARAHCSIFERHSESLCSLVQSINANQQRQTLEPNQEEEVQIGETSGTPPPPFPSSSISTGSRLLDLIRPSRQTRGNSISIEDGAISPSQQTLVNKSNRLRNRSLTSDFLKDDWHCILFHLRLLIESVGNTKESMNQALALMEHQEQLRQNRIQDQEERCRVLEDSLHALARDHHELEKSFSMSQIYHSANNRSLSMSMSTDLNEYHDAFEDFDDDNTSRTLTPTSLPTDDDLNRRIQEVMNENEQESSRPRMVNSNLVASHRDETDDDDDDDDEMDLRSNCSALTVETVEDHTSDSKQGNTNNPKVDGSLKTYRTRLPCTMVPRDQVSIWSILKNCIGKELSKITMPVVFNEPLTMLQRGCEGIQFAHYVHMADESDDPIERMELICAFIVAGLSANCHRIIKPFNPLLYETYEYTQDLDDGSQVKAVAQQVSHHPPITAVCGESNHFIFNGSVNPKIKFWGRSVEVQPDGQCRIYLKRHKETYVYKSVTCSIHNIIVGKLWFEHRGPLDVKCLETNVQANLVFKPAGWFSNDLHRFDGVIVQGHKAQEKRRYIYGKWSDYIKSVDYVEYEKYMKDNQQKLFRIPDSPDEGQANGLIPKMNSLTLGKSTNNNNNNIDSSQEGETIITSSTGNSKSLKKDGDTKKEGNYTKSESTQSLDIPKSKTLWRLEAEYLEEYYNFTSFTMKLNELTPDLEKVLPKTDSRFRLDVRKLEEGDLDGAAAEKQRLEEKQRDARSKDKRFKEPSADFLWFDLINVPDTKEKFWIYKGGYWESKCNPEKFPDLF